MTTAELIAEAESISNLYRTEAKFSPLRMVGSLEAVTKRLRETDPVLREVMAWMKKQATTQKSINKQFGENDDTDEWLQGCLQTLAKLDSLMKGKS